MTATTAVLTGCRTGTAVPRRQATAPPIVAVEVEGCGRRHPTAQGIVVDEHVVLTVAHVLAGARRVTAAGRDATIVAVDLERDLATIHADGVGLDGAAPVSFGRARPGDVTIAFVGGETNARITSVAMRSIDDPDPALRHRRRIAELDVAVADGQSGSAVLNHDGELVAVVFATDTTKPDLTYAVEAVLPEADGPPPDVPCP